MIRSFKSAYVLVTAALLCMMLGCMTAFAASYTMGPGDHYDSQGNIVSLDGTVLVTKDGTVLVTEEDANRQGYFTNVVTDAAGSSSNASGGRAQYTGSVVKDTPGAAYQTGSVTALKDGTVVYTFEGKQYKKKTSTGVRKLSGYTGDTETASGRTPLPNHTVAASSDIPLGTAIIIEGVSGPYPDKFNGVYIVDDRGDYHIEVEKWIDIFFSSEAGADYVTDEGWNYAEVWIAEAL